MTKHAFQNNKPDRVMLLAQAPVYILLILFLGLFIYSISQRVPYPFEIEWIEGEMICHAMQLVNGHRIYAPPSTEFIAEIYPPVYYILVASLFKTMNAINFIIPRIVSVVSLIGIVFILYRIPLKEGGTKSTAIITSGFFISFYEIHGPWYDLARVDMLLFFLVLLGCYILAYFKRKTFAAICSAVIFVLACYTKQTGLYFLPFAALYLLFTDKRQCLIFSGAVILLLVSVFLGLQYVTDGWFGIYALFNPLRYNQVLTKPLPELQFGMLLFELRKRLLPEMRYEIFYKLPVFYSIILAFIIQKVISITKKTTVTIWEYTAIAAASAYFSIRPHPGSERNDFICMTLWGCLLLGLFLIKLNAAPLFTDRRNSIRATTYLLLAVQLCLQIYNPHPLVPTPQDIKKGKEFISMVKRLPGEVYIPNHSFYAVMAGKKMVFNAGAYGIYQILAEDKFKADDLIKKIKNNYFSAIIIDDKGYLTMKGERIVIDNIQVVLTSGDELSKAVAEQYKLEKKFSYSNDDEFRNVTGFNTRPELILVPKNP